MHTEDAARGEAPLRSRTLFYIRHVIAKTQKNPVTVYHANKSVPRSLVVYR